tara:strand:+ start:17266 stop:19404 length:2139 start_codon:yes stop_codon:yes gene_type:complete
MQKLQLYISGERIDLFKDEQVSISLSQQDVKDPAKIFAEFTKTFTIPASKSNNIIFEHYYNFNITDGFDARNKIASNIELNNIPYKEGFVALNGVELKDNKAYAYKITFYGNTINLTKVFGDDDLSDLSELNVYNLNYTANDVKTKLQGAVGDDVIAPLITHTEQLFYDTNASVQTFGNLNYINGQNHGVLYSELKYAIRVDVIVQAIQAHYLNSGLPAFSDDFFNITKTQNKQYNNLYLWLHRKKGNVASAQQVVTFATQVAVFELSSTNDPNQSNTILSGGGTTISIIPGFEDLLTNTLDLFVKTGFTSIPYTVELWRNGSLYWTSTEAAGSRSFTKSTSGGFGTLPVGTYYLNIRTATAMTFTNIQWTFQGDIQEPQAPNGWENIYETNPSPQSTSKEFNATLDFEFVISAQIPTIKVIDFMNGLFRMFNLTAYFDNQPLLVNGNTNPDFGKIKIQTLDDFYATNFNTWNISEYVDVKQSSVDVGLPYNEISFSYEGLETLLAATFSQENSTSWGALKYSGGTRVTGPNTAYNILVPFEHMQYERLFNQSNNQATTIQYGRFVDDNQEPYLGKPLLFYPIKQTNGTEISFMLTTASNVAIDDYIIPSNSQELAFSTSTSNINFNDETNEYTGASGFTGTLFNNYYNTYISDVFNRQRRIIKVKAFLPLSIIYKLQMNDVMTINNQDYIINKAQINLITGESSFELLNKV